MDPSQHAKSHHPPYSPLQCTATDQTFELYQLFSQHPPSLASHHSLVEHPFGMLPTQTATAYTPFGTFPTRDTWDQIFVVWPTVSPDSSERHSQAHRRSTLLLLAKGQTRWGCFQHNPRSFPHSTRSVKCSTNKTNTSTSIDHTQKRPYRPLSWVP
jgi:hypothetical protein